MTPRARPPLTRCFAAPPARGCCAALLLCGLACLPACSADPAQGYSFKPLHDENYRTIAVPVFDNETFSTGLEIELTEAIIKEIQRTTRWAVVPAGEADTVLSGSITGSELRRFSADSETGLVREMGVELRVDFDWQDNRSGRSLVARRGFAALDTFVPAQGTGERIEKGQHGVVQLLARDIVAELRSTW